MPGVVPSSYEVKKGISLRQPMIVCPTVPPVCDELLEEYSALPSMVLEEFHPRIWMEDERDRSKMMAHFDTISETRKALFYLAIIIKVYKRKLEQTLAVEDVNRIFLTVEALFWYHLDLHQSLVGAFKRDKAKAIARELKHFIEASSLDQAIFFAEFPGNLDYLDGIVQNHANIHGIISACDAKLAGYEKQIARKLSLAHLMGFFYKRFQELKTQVCLLINGSQGSSELPGLDECKQLLDSYELSCGKILESRVELIGLFNAFSKTDGSKLPGDTKKVFAPLDVRIDRRESLKATIRQMQLNSKVRYNLAVFWVEYTCSKPGKACKTQVTDRQFSISIFSRHMALLEIVFPPWKLFKKRDPNEWTYRLMYPLIPLDRVSFHDPPSLYDLSSIIEVRLKDYEPGIMYFKCEDDKHRKDLMQQFRLIHMEACPDPSVQYEWRKASDVKSTPSVQEMLETEGQLQAARFSSAENGAPSTAVKPNDLIKYVQPMDPQPVFQPPVQA